MKKPYQVGKFSLKSWAKVLTVDEVARIIASQNLEVISKIWLAKYDARGAPLRDREEHLFGSVRRDLEFRHAQEARARGVVLRERGIVAAASDRNWVVSRRLPLAAKDPACTLKGEGVVMYTGAGREADRLYEVAAAHALMLLLGQRRCLASRIDLGAGEMHYSLVVHEWDRTFGRMLTAMIRSFGKEQLPDPRDALLERAARTGESIRLRGKTAVKLVTEIERLRALQSEITEKVGVIEDQLLERMDGAAKAMLDDHSEVNITPVHRAAHYVAASDFTQIRISR